MGAIETRFKLKLTSNGACRTDAKGLKRWGEVLKWSVCVAIDLRYRGHRDSPRLSRRRESQRAYSAESDSVIVRKASA